MEDEFVKRLKERYERGEISKDIYEDILSRYLSEKGERKESETTAEQVDKVVNEETQKAMGEKKSRNDYKCAGSCTIPPGKYGYVSGAGSIRITGNMVAVKVSVAGSLHAESDIKAEFFRSAGSAKIDGNLDAEDISAGGLIHVKNLNGERIKIGGALVCDSIKGGNVNVGGSVKAKSLSGKDIKIKLDGKSAVDEIHGEKIEVKSKRGIIRRFSGHLKSKKIAGEEIYLECTTADIVDGVIVVIGDKCKINVVKGEKIKTSENSTVEKVIKK